MNNFLPVLISIIVIFAIVLLLGRKFNLSSKYERKPRALNTWSALDHGIDPTDEKNS